MPEHTGQIKMKRWSRTSFSFTCLAQRILLHATRRTPQPDINAVDKVVQSCIR